MTLAELREIRSRLRLYKEWSIMIYGSNAWVWLSHPFTSWHVSDTPPDDRSPDDC